MVESNTSKTTKEKTMSRKVLVNTVTISHPAPMQSKVASNKGLLGPVDYRRKTEARRVRKQEKRAWMREEGLV